MPADRVPEDLVGAGRPVEGGIGGPPICNLFLHIDMPLSMTLSMSFVLQQGVGG